ncbi:MAG: hypothetical protein LUE98_04655 [Tannerellaceae bacterium]|nr:hypothetical protein [Tannerellaceae bacterium]
MAYDTPAPCDLQAITEADNCGEATRGIATIIYVGFKGDLKARPRLKTPSDGNGSFGLGDYSYVEETPGFTAANFKDGKSMVEWEIRTDSGQFTLSSNGQKAGFTQTLTFGFDQMTPEIASMLRVINNRKDIFFAIPEGDQFQLLYDPDRNVSIDSGGIAYDSGTTPDSDSGVTIAINLSTVSSKTYYNGTVSTTPATTP